MAGIEKKSFDVPDEVRNPYEKVRVDVLETGEWLVKRVTVEPGWRWTEHNQRVDGTELCEVFHIKLILHGRFGVAMKDGTQTELGPAEIGIVGPGHDAWTVGDEPCAFIDLAELVRQTGRHA